MCSKAASSNYECLLFLKETCSVFGFWHFSSGVSICTPADTVSSITLVFSGSPGAPECERPPGAFPSGCGSSSKSMCLMGELSGIDISFLAD